MLRTIIFLGLAVLLVGCRSQGTDGGIPNSVVSLVYEVDLAEGQKADPATMKSLAAVLQKRLDPNGEVGVDVRVVGDSQIDIRSPRDEKLTVDRIKRLVGMTGDLRFRISANSHDHQMLIEAARRQASSEDRKLAVDVKDADGKTIGFWAAVPRVVDPLKVGPAEFVIVTEGMLVRDAKSGDLVEADDRRIASDPSQFARYLTDQGIEAIEVLIFDDDGVKLGGADIGQSQVETDTNGQPCLHFTMRNAEAARRMSMLTGKNLPEHDFARQLAILLDSRVLVAPSIRGMIGDRGQITGRFTLAEVEEMDAILKSGTLPVNLKPTPVSESVIN